MDNFDLKKYLAEGKMLQEDNLKDYWPEWAAGEIEVGNENVIDAGGINADFGKVSNQTMNTFKDYVRAVKALNANSKELRNDLKKYLAEGKLNEQMDLSNRQYSAKKLFALIARDIQFADAVQNDEMLDADEAIEIMRHVIEIEGTESSPEDALGEYIAKREL